MTDDSLFTEVRQASEQASNIILLTQPGYLSFIIGPCYFWRYSNAVTFENVRFLDPFIFWKKWGANVFENWWFEIAF